MLEQINRLAQRGLGVIMISHFPDHVFLCSTKDALMQKHNVIIVGSVDEVATEENLKLAYGINVLLKKEPFSS